MTDTYTVKVCNHCGGKGIINTDDWAVSGNEDHTKFIMGSYEYLPYYGKHPCAECGGAGIVRYKIRTIPEESETAGTTPL